ncbi:hypothetical protein [Microbacterium candidum]|uniref:DUF4913 domain-containing protein n=1 Tax=Microbacterium candidum TaxID=3041922 RepID=A0ABT7MW24_9MICO|nr:hypothetical protein [Microbacterium sp. ASV49]MDL9978615.1 hypothetical protein [Microbacterium sp. ASV49]
MKERDNFDTDAQVAAEMAGFHAESRGGASDPLGAHAVNWRRMPDADAPREWVELRAWVEWFTVRYSIPVSVVPNCWWKHGALVEELSALHVAHLASFDASDSGFGAIGWHERLALATPRLSRAGAGCASGHSATRPRSWAGATDEAEWAAWASQAHAR